MSAPTETKYAALGQKIRKARKRKGLSQERVAEMIGITRRHLIRIENGEHLPSRELRDRLAATTDSERDELAVAEDDEEADPVALFAALLERAVDAAVAKRFGAQNSQHEKGRA